MVFIKPNNGTVNVIPVIFGRNTAYLGVVPAVEEEP
jgi:hypothetical protein